MVDVIPESGSKKGKYLKIVAEINLEKPLLRGSKIRYNDKEVWVEFKYENMSIFCFYYGRMDHRERNCSHKKQDANEMKLVEGQYSDWLRADLSREGFKQPKPLDLGKQKISR